MDMILVKLFATALALSEVMTQPQAVKTQFDPVKDQDAVVQILRDGCAHMRQAFDIESINVDDLITTALDDPAAVGGNIKAFHGLNFADLNTAYKQFCKNETVANPVVDIGQVITFYNNAAADLPDPARLKGKQLPGMSAVLDGKGDHYADVFQPGNRRVWVRLADVPDFVQKAFIAAEDRRFYQHHGIDEHGIIRAFIGNLAESGRPQGGSTITQQVVKNLLVGDDVTYERKIREMIVASRLESTIGKNDILELYINSVYLGRGSWGIEMAAKSYFGKSAKDLTLPEGTMLAGLLKGPSFYNPDRHPDRAKERLVYVLGRMQEDGVISAEQKNTAALPKRVVYAMPHRDSGFNFVDYLGRESKIADAVKKIGSSPAGMPAWQQALQAVRLPLYDVHWTPAAIVQKGDGKKDDGNIRVGLPDGRIMPLTGLSYVSRRGLGLYDVVYVNVVESRRSEVRAPAVDARGNPVKPKPQVVVSSGQ